MTQVSANTLTYDQIFIKVKDFYLKEFKNEFPTNEERVQEYKKLVSDIYDNLGGLSSKFVPYIKGETPTSNKFNEFSANLGNDVALVSKQIDYLNAKVVNSFNLFNQEIETEKRYIERISSKSKILQMYTEAPANDLFYYGDSFDNQDQIDITQVTAGLNPHVENGMLTLPLQNARPWMVKDVSIDTSVSNGFLGNDHQIIKSVDPLNINGYEYYYKKNKTISNISSLLDSNPVTFFEYSAVKVDKSSNPNYNSNVSENEFCYLANKKVTPSKTDGELINWSNFDISKNLTLKLSMVNSSGDKANMINIVPYFGSATLIKVSSILATLKDGSIKEILESPIYIGSSFSPTSIGMAKNYFFNSATIRFSEISAIKFDILFEQEDHQDIEIYHAYWRPNYQNRTTVDSPFVNLDRFNPDSFGRDKYDLIEYDRNQLVPSIEKPNEFKNIDHISKNINVKIRKKANVFDGYVVAVDVIPQGSTSTNAIPMYIYNKKDDGSFIYAWDLQSFFQFTNVDSLNYKRMCSTNAADLQAFSDSLVSYTTFTSITGPDNNTRTYVSSTGLPPSPVHVNYKYTENIINYSVPITLDKEVYKAQKKSIGIRDINIVHEVYADSCEVVSTEYKYSSPVDSLMIAIESDIDNKFIDKLNVKYYVSLNKSSWIEISPIQLYNYGIPEVLVLNQNIPLNFQIPGVAYLNSPDIASEINSIRVKISLSKDRNYNISPSIYSYKLIAKVKN